MPTSTIGAQWWLLASPQEPSSYQPPSPPPSPFPWHISSRRRVHGQGVILRTPPRTRFSLLLILSPRLTLILAPARIPWASSRRLRAPIKVVGGVLSRSPHLKTHRVRSSKFVLLMLVPECSVAAGTGPALGRISRLRELAQRLAAPGPTFALGLHVPR